LLPDHGFLPHRFDQPQLQRHGRVQRAAPRGGTAGDRHRWVGS
jgi:hypothetical protein